MLGPEIVEETTEKIRVIRDRLRVGQDRQTKYANPKRRDVSFQVGDKVLLRVSPVRGVVRFGKRNKLGPRYIGPYKVLEVVGNVAYKLALPPDMSHTNNVFDVSMIKKCTLDSSQVLSNTPTTLEEDLFYEERPERVIDYQERRLRKKTIPMVKVQWQNHSGREATWEVEENMRS